MTSQAKVVVCDTPEELAQIAAERFVTLAHERGTERFNVSLAGGKTPRRVYELLASEEFRNRIEWARVHLFFGDERCVPPDHEDSNYAMVFESLISRVEIPEANVHRIVGEAEPHVSASAYENELRRFFPDELWPRFDLVFLGMGTDGHTASLFPDSDALFEKSRWVIATTNGQLHQRRITLTVPALNHASSIIFLVTGKEKSARLAQVLHAEGDVKPLPARLIHAGIGMDETDKKERTVEWLVDSAVASRL